MHWTREISWCADLLQMYERWCDARGLGQPYYDNYHYRRAWVKMVIWLGNGEAHKIINHRRKGTVPRIIEVQDR